MAWIRGENISRELLKQLLGEEPPGVVRGQPVLGRSPCAEDTRAQTCLPLKSPFGFPHPHSLTQCNVSTEPLKPGGWALRSLTNHCPPLPSPGHTPYYMLLTHGAFPSQRELVSEF